MNVKDLTLTALIAALYATLVVVLAPISYGPIQLRAADCLIPLAALFGLPAVAGVSLGALVANTYYFLSPIDVVLGTLANLIAAYIIFRLRRRLLLACVVGSCVIGGIVGGYLWLFFPPPDILGLTLPVWLAMMLSITISSLVAIAVLGYGLVKALRASGFDRILKSKGVMTN
ncbi:MAG: QueT transporter family protein [Candidatus Bathyarchaeota archaeon]|nr:QueT transporter family protein [Candidatus Bathyarchaeota archaeon]